MKSLYKLLVLLSYILFFISCESFFLSELDECGVPGGDNSTCLDECNVPNGSGIEEGKCDCDGNMIGCDGKCGSNKLFDICGVCGGGALNDSNCGCENPNEIRDCLGECSGSAILDDCGICNGDGITCKGCMIEGSDNFSTSFTIEDNESCYINFSTVEPIINNNCIGCHGNSGEVNLESYSEIINGFTVSKSDSSRSLLYQVITKQSGYYMPPSGSLSDEEIRKIALWIQFGAKEIN